MRPMSEPFEQVLLRYISLLIYLCNILIIEKKIFSRRSLKVQSQDIGESLKQKLS